MTTPTLTTSTSITTDPRPLFSAAIEIAHPVIAGVRADQFGLSSPCVDFDVKGVLDHLVFVLHRVAKLCRGQEAFAPGSLGDDDIEHADHAANWQAAAVEVEADYADDAILARTIVLPWAALTGAEMLATYTSEVT